MNRYSVLLIAFLFAGCATAPPPPLTADNPASPSAPEATIRPIRNALGVDDLTTKTRQIFVQAAKEQPSPAPTPQQQQMDQMPGMNMPQE
jgi:hypothetical protein